MRFDLMAQGRRLLVYSLKVELSTKPCLRKETRMKLRTALTRRELLGQASTGALAAAGATFGAGLLGNPRSAVAQLPDLGIGADLQGNRPFPADNPWNQDISALPVDPDSNNLISNIGLTTGLHPDFGSDPTNGIPYIVVPGSQARVPITFNAYPTESDPGPYPVPPNAPIEGGGDRHVLVVDRDNWMLYEMFLAYLNANGSSWTAGCGAVFNLNSDALRPAGWTSADAAGLPILPGLVRYDEVVTHGVIKHALRFTVRYTRRAYVSPARHYASNHLSTHLAPMGMRVRLKKSVNISNFAPSVQVILTALKKYGMFVADNGSNWYISGAPDPRWNDTTLHTLNQIKGSDFEVVKMGTIVTH
jgi:hypothetical protein